MTPGIPETRVIQDRRAILQLLPGPQVLRDFQVQDLQAERVILDRKVDRLDLPASREIRGILDRLELILR